MKGGTSPEVPKARESRGEPRVGRVRGSGPCRGVIERPGGSRHDILQLSFGLANDLHGRRHPCHNVFFIIYYLFFPIIFLFVFVGMGTALEAKAPTIAPTWLGS